MDKLTRRLRLYLLAGLTFLSSSVCKATELVPTTIRDFRSGLQTKEDPTIIPEGAAQDLSNVDVYTGAVEKRRGSIKQNSSVIGGFSSQAVRFLHEYVDTSNNDYMLFVTSNSLYRSTDGGATSTLITSTYGVTSSSRFCGVNAFGNAYLTDGTTNWLILNGTSLSATTAPPKGLTCEFFGERIITSTGSTVSASRVGDATDWTADAGTDNDAFSTNVRQNNGYTIKCIKRFRFGLLVFKDYSTDLFTLSSDGLTFIQTPVSSTIGTQYPESVVERENDAVWLAHDGYYSFDGSTLRKISSLIDPTVYSIQQLNSSSRNAVITSQSDFQAGTIGTGLSATSSPGDVLFGASTVIDSWTDGNFTSNPSWTTSTTGGAAWSVGVALNLHYVATTGGTGVIYTTNTTADFGAWTITHGAQATQHSSSDDWIFKLSAVAPASTDFTSGAGYYIRVSRFNSTITITEAGVGNVCSGSATIDNTSGVVRFERDSSGVFSAYYNNSFVCSGTDTTTTSFTYISFFGQGDASNTVSFDVYDLSFDYFSATYQSSPQTIGTSITSWGNITLGFTNNSGSHTFAVYGDTDTNITITNTATFTSSQTITSGSVPTISTAAYLTVTDVFSRTVSTQTPTLSDITISWNEGSSLFPVASIYYQGDMISSVAISSTSRNDRMLVYDRNGNWTMYAYPAYYLKLYRQRPYFGSGIQGDIARFQVDGTYQDYDSSAINSYWVSKEFDFGYPLTNKTINRYYVTTKYRANSTATFEWGVNRNSLTSESSLSSVNNGSLDLDSVSGSFSKTIIPSSLTYKKGLTHRFKLSNSVLNERFDLLSVTLRADLETSP